MVNCPSANYQARHEYLRNYTRRRRRQNPVLHFSFWKKGEKNLCRFWSPGYKSKQSSGSENEQVLGSITSLSQPASWLPSNGTQMEHVPGTIQRRSSLAQLPGLLKTHHVLLPRCLCTCCSLWTKRGSPSLVYLEGRTVLGLRMHLWNQTT